MAHFAVLNKKLIEHPELGIVKEVVGVVVVSNSKILDNNQNEDETLGIDFLSKLIGEDFDFKQCSYNASVNKFRNVFPGKGYFWIENSQAFIAPKPLKNLSRDKVMLNGEWVFNEEILNWKFIEQ